MLAARTVRLCLNPSKGSLLRSGFTGSLRHEIRESSNVARQGARRRNFREAAQEAASAPSTGSAISIGQGAVAGASVLGLGALAYYGLGLSNQVGTVDKAAFWPQHVKERVRDTYAYFGASLGLTAASAYAVFNNNALRNLVMRQGWMAMGVSFAAMIGSSMVARGIPYQEGFGAKQLAWMAHTGVIGAVIAPLCLLGGPILTRAAWYTAGMVGGLSTVALCAPSDKFLAMGGPLAMGFGVVFMSSIASAFLPPTTALGAGVYSIALYGGLVLFGGFMLYDTQKIIKRAENHPQYGMTKYDPINASMSIYMDTINIFVRIAQILAGGGGRRK